MSSRAAYYGAPLGRCGPRSPTTLECNPRKLGAFDKEALRMVPKAAQLKIMECFKQIGKPINGWTFTTKAGIYGTDYVDRALVTAIRLKLNYHDL